MLQLIMKLDSIPEGWFGAWNSGMNQQQFHLINSAALVDCLIGLIPASLIFINSAIFLLCLVNFPPNPAPTNQTSAEFHHIH